MKLALREQTRCGLKTVGLRAVYVCSLKTLACPLPHSLSRCFEKRSSGHPLMVEGESRPEGAEHCASSYIVDGTSQCRDHAVDVTLLLSQVAKGNANRVVPT